MQEAEVSDALAEQALVVLEREYQRCLAASAARAPALEAEELAEATEAAEAAGYGAIGIGGGFTSSDDEEGEEGEGDSPHDGYAAFQNDSDDEGMQAPSDDPEAVAAPATDAPPAAKDDRIGSSCAPPVRGSPPPTAAVGTDACSSGWTATFPEFIDGDAGDAGDGADACAVELTPAPPPPPLPAVPLPPDRVATIKQVMAGLSLAPPPPAWASTVPESVWMHEILGGGRGGGGRGGGRRGGQASNNKSRAGRGSDMGDGGTSRGKAAATSAGTTTRKPAS